MRLYKLRRVERAEASPAFQEAQQARKGKREAAQKGLATKKRKIDEYVASVKIEVPPIAKPELIRLACENYNANRRGDSVASEHSDPMFLERICVNYLRHCLTQYESHLGEIAGKVGTHDAYLDIKTNVLEAIAAEYPWLSDECRRQRQRMWALDFART
jgi:hypothetical protein